MKKTLALILGAATVLSLASCGNKSEDDSIIFLNFKPEVADNYVKIAEAYKTETGKTVTVKTAASGSYDTTLTADMGADKTMPAIFQVNGAVGLSKWKDYTVDLSSDELYTKLTDKSLALKNGSAVAAFPITVEGYGIIYNSEITDKYFQLSDIQTAVASMDAIDSFADLKTVVEDMQSHATKLGIKGVFSSTSLKHGDDWRYQTHLVSPALTGEFGGSITAVPKEFSFTYNAGYKNLLDLYLDNNVRTKAEQAGDDVNTAMAEMASGDAVMGQNGNWATGQICGKGSKVKAEKLKFLPLYMGDMGDNVKEANQGLCVGTENFVCINSKVSAAKQQAAKDFLHWLYQGNGKAYVAKATTDGGLGFIPTFDGFTGDLGPSDPLSKSIVSWMSKDGKSSLPWTFNYIPSQQWKDDFGINLAKYAIGNMQWNDVVSAASAEWKTEAAKL